MPITVAASILLAIAAFPFVYYTLVLYSSWRFFRFPSKEKGPNPIFAPPVSILKPVRGLDPEAYENFASFCRQDYPEYELIFCVGSAGDPALAVIEQLQRDFPERSIRVVFRSSRAVSNDKVAKLDRLVSEARYEHVVINDSDVRVNSNYLRTVISPLARSDVGAVTCLYVSAGDKGLIDKFQTIGIISDLFAGILVAWQLDGVKFALGQTIVTTRARLAGFGGYRALENRPADDLLVGRLIAEQGYEVELLPYAVETVPDYASLRELVQKRLRWIVVMRHMRPWGHLGLLLAQGLPWSIAAVLIHPSLMVAYIYFGIYFALRAAMTWIIGVRGLKRSSLWKCLPMILVWDATAFVIWAASFARNSIRWRGGEYYIRNGMLVPTTPPVTSE